MDSFLYGTLKIQDPEELFVGMWRWQKKTSRRKWRLVACGTLAGELSNQFYEELNRMFNLRHHLRIDAPTPVFEKELNRLYFKFFLDASELLKCGF